MLDPNYTTLSIVKVEKMIYNAIYGCFSVTYLDQPVTQCWSLIQIETTSIDRLLTDSSSPFVDLEYTSDDDTLLPISSLPIVNEPQHQTHSPSSFNLHKPFFTSKKYAQHSTVACTKRNKKRNNVHRLYRYIYSIIRNVSHRFTKEKDQAYTLSTSYAFHSY
ncbi:unnamed protein product [Rotaria sp. Silwood2]|nr:unnamed protein product [Rotaria sp. Silwood2]CAF2524512.1 unnamed protein product [Rotaria sp. Silwood2]CAF2771618.1 unnamed protein product [Rotaria sp. Silwood2]CAF2947040.1 unnamed protein product [Rotaria sp. Silwood2]CAF4031111.1 unnamed protein product [Rotaria sp. Silwood2]